MAILTTFRHRFYKNDGTVNAGGKVWTYEAGTTTPKITYTDSTGVTPNSNPVLLNAKGEPESGGSPVDIWVTGQLKINVLESDDTQVTGWPVDNVGSGVSNNDANARWAGTAGGSANALTISPSPSITAYVAGQSFIFKSSASANTAATTISISGLAAIAVQSNGAACSGGEILANNWYQIVLSTTSICQISKIGEPTLTELGAAALASSALSQDFRISLTTALPVTTSDVTGATTIYAVPRTGNRIALYDGTKFINYVSAEFSLSLGTITNDQGYDVFCYQNAGVPTLELLAWTNNNTRATALAYSSGILVKSGDATRRYLSSFLTTSTTTTEDSATNRYLWNYYHRVPRAMSRFEISSWTYTTATLRQANNSTSNQLNFFVGLREDSVDAQLVAANVSTIVGNSGAIGIGDNSVTAISALSSAARLFTASTSALVVGSATFSGPVNNLGKNYLAWLEHADASGTMTWYGATGNGKSGLTGSVMA